MTGDDNCFIHVYHHKRSSQNHSPLPGTKTRVCIRGRNGDTDETNVRQLVRDPFLWLNISGSHSKTGALTIRGGDTMYRNRVTYRLFSDKTVPSLWKDFRREVLNGLQKGDLTFSVGKWPSEEWPPWADVLTGFPTFSFVPPRQWPTISSTRVVWVFPSGRRTLQRDRGGRLFNNCSADDNSSKKE